MSTGRIAAVFARARAEKRIPLVLYLTASDPDFDTSLRLVLAAAEAGADIIELGVPWSDPSADGLAIQGAMMRALQRGGGLSSTLKLCAAIRERNPALPIVLFGYANPIVAAGVNEFARRAAAAGADATLCVDWPSDEDPELPDALRAAGLDLVPLLAPTSTVARAQSAIKVAGGFIYYVSLTGITGAALTDGAAARKHVDEIRAQMAGTPSPLPVVVGFGIKTPADARAAAAYADGVVVGSAAVRVIEEGHAAGRDPVPEMTAFVRSLSAALRG